MPGRWIDYSKARARPLLRDEAALVEAAFYCDGQTDAMHNRADNKLYDRERV